MMQIWSNTTKSVVLGPSELGHLSQIWLSWGVLDTTLFDKDCQWLVAGQWFLLGTSVSPTNKSNRHEIKQILLKVALTLTRVIPDKM
jgi:hypothetical protein